MTISFEIPQEIEQQIRTNGTDLDRQTQPSILENALESCLPKFSRANGVRRSALV